MSRSKEELNKRIDELGTEFRRLFTTVAAGLFIGILIKGSSPSQGQSGQDSALLIVGVSVILVLCNVLRAKHRNVVKRDKVIAEDKTPEKSGYPASIAATDLIALIILAFGIWVLMFGLPCQFNTEKSESSQVSTEATSGADS